MNNSEGLDPLDIELLPANPESPRHWPMPYPPSNPVNASSASITAPRATPQRLLGRLVGLADRPTKRATAYSNVTTSRRSYP